jgi:hypothetical protein
MTALDTARLMWIIDGGAGTLWRKPGGGAVTAGLLKASSRTFLRRLLEDDAWNNTLSSANWCGRQRFGRVFPAFGIPQRVPTRWISRRTGSVNVHGDDFGQAVEPCQRAAEVRFAHKIGLVDDHASDAGIVRSLPSAPFRRYVVAVLGNLGSRYGDPEFAGLGRSPCSVPSIGICRTERFARLGKLIDTAIARPRLAYDPLIARAGTRQPALAPTRIDPASGLSNVTVTPALPAGLTLDPATGTISGTPRERTALRRHTVTATDAQGTVSAPLWIVVRGASAAANRVSVTEPHLAW